MSHPVQSIVQCSGHSITTQSLKPTFFGRSILTVPWVELGGKVSINCPQTNYVANIEFKCKQFFSSEVNKVRFL